VLVYASHDAALFARGKGFALEAVDAAVEALLDEVGVHLRWLAADSKSACAIAHVHKLFHLLLLHACLQLALLRCGKPGTRSVWNRNMTSWHTHESMVVEVSSEGWDGMRLQKFAE
jgi:hypothetical protein